MATFESTTYAGQKSTRVLSGRSINPNVVSGEVEYAVVPYTLDGDEAHGTSDTINLCKLPAGCWPLPSLSHVVCEDPGTTLVVDVGYASNPDALADGMVLSAGGIIQFLAPAIPADALVPAALPTEDIIVTIANAASLTAGAELVFYIAYRRNR